MTQESEFDGGNAKDVKAFSEHAPFAPVEARYPYYIVTPPYEPRSAGIKALHLLCHWLNRAGFPAFLHILRNEQDGLSRADLVTPLLTAKVASAYLRAGVTPVVVYPEIVPGNPLQAECVIRYVLNYPGLLGGDKTFDPKDMVFTYSQRLAEAIGNAQGVMHMPLVDTSVFHTAEDEDVPRKGSCFYAYKFRKSGGVPFGIPDDAVEILNETAEAQTPVQIAELLRRCEKFYAFEDTALILEAALCGCPSVLMRSDYFKSPLGLLEYGGAGMALGDSDGEITRARETLDEAARIYKASIEQFWRQFQDFIVATQEKAARASLSSVVIQNSEMKIAAEARDVLFAGLKYYSIVATAKYYLNILSKRARRHYREKRRVASQFEARYRKLGEL